MRRALVIVLMLLPAALSSAAACPVCFGDKDSPMTAGMNTAILVMLGIVGSVLSGFIAFFLYMWRRFRRQQQALSQEAYVSDEGILRLHNRKGKVEWNNS